MKSGWEVRLAVKAVCTGSYAEISQFDELFAAYWLNRGRERPGQAQPAGGERQRSSALQDQDGMAGGPIRPMPMARLIRRAPGG